MTIDIRVLDDAAIANDPRIDRWLAALALERTQALIENAHVDFRIVEVAGEIVAIAAAEPGPVRSYVCSPITHYARYPAAEARRLEPAWLRPIARLAFLTAGVALRLCALDRVVYVDNWLLATNPVRSLGEARYRAVVEWLVRQYPAHAIVHRNVNPALDDRHARALADAGFRSVRARVVYIADPTNRRARANENLRRDTRLADGARERSATSRDPGDARSFADLYRSLYLDRHTPLNPAYTTAAFTTMLASGSLDFRVMRAAEEPGLAVGFASSFRRGGVLTGAVIGFDIRRNRDEGLYRMLVATLYREAARSGCVLNLSGGAGGFKTARSARPVSEFDAVYDRHLSIRRRLGWRIAGALGRLWRVRRPSSA